MPWNYVIIIIISWCSCCTDRQFVCIISQTIVTHNTKKVLVYTWFGRNSFRRRIRTFCQWVRRKLFPLLFVKVIMISNFKKSIKSNWLRCFRNFWIWIKVSDLMMLWAIVNKVLQINLPQYVKYLKSGLTWSNLKSGGLPDYFNLFECIAEESWEIWNIILGAYVFRNLLHCYRKLELEPKD